jgi:hypothetical protein
MAQSSVLRLVEYLPLFLCNSYFSMDQGVYFIVLKVIVFIAGIIVSAAVPWEWINKRDK